jgi:hypothetical protein
VLERAAFYATVVALEEEWRKRRKPEKPGLTITPPEVERLFAEVARLRELHSSEDEPPIGGYVN